MRKHQAAGILLLAALGGCVSSDRTITLEEDSIRVGRQRFETGYFALTYSSDGELTAGLSEDQEVFEVREVSTGNLVGSFAEAFNGLWPALFSQDNESLILIDLSKKSVESIVVPVTGAVEKPLASSQAALTWVEEEDGGGGDVAYNYNYTLAAADNGAVFFRDGSIVAVEGAIGDPYFDQYGAVWYRTGSEWSSVNLEKTVTRGVAKPAFLVEWQILLRGSMSLLADQTEMTRHEADAYVTAVWLDHEKAVETHDKEEDKMMQDRTALVYVGADVVFYSFVPNRRLIAVVTQAGTAFVPYTVEPRAVDRNEREMVAPK